MWGAIASTLIGGAMQHYANNKAMSNQQAMLKNIKTEYQPWKDSLDEYDKTSKDYMSVGSQVNQDMRTDIRQNALDFLSSQNRLNARNLSSGGLGGFSGLQNAMGASNLQSVLAQSEDSFQNQFKHNQKLGLSLMDKYTQGLRQYGEAMGQGHIQNTALRNQMLGAQGSMGAGLFSSGLKGIFDS
tara:strand:- start:366 stop:920 length:555 start_codon:yes stop_codon:yes gene_type:complete